MKTLRQILDLWRAGIWSSCDFQPTCDATHHLSTRG
jgi:hypothetical protein